MTALLIRLFIKNSDCTAEPTVREAYGKLGGTVGIACNILLCLVKITVGLLTASMSILADGLNNLSDMGSSVITIIGFRMSNKPADRDHPFGHGRIEYLSALVVGILILFVGAELLISSGKALIYGEDAPQYTVVSLIVLAISVLIKFWMFLFNRKLGKTIQSEVLLATAQDSVNDCIASTVILASVVISMLVRIPFQLDAVMACGVALFILWSGINVLKETVSQLLGQPPAPELIAELETTILSFTDFVGIHDLIVHNYGPGRQFASVHVEVPQTVDIVSCHERIDLCEKLVEEKTGVQLVIHMDPIDTDNEVILETKKEIAEKITAIHKNLSIHDFRMTPICDKKTNLIFDVVVPTDLKISQKELGEKICNIANEINPTFCCVISYDNDYTGN